MGDSKQQQQQQPLLQAQKVRDDEEKEEDWIKMLSSLSDDDIESISFAHKPTSEAQELIHKCTRWIPSAPHCFWSGRQGRRQAHMHASKSDYQSDADIPFISKLFRLCTQAHIDTQQAKRMSFAVSRLFAYFSKGPIAIVFLASDKPSESPGLTVGTNFWEAELPVLSSQLQVGHLTEIQFIHISSGPETITRQVPLTSLPIYRRYAHPLMDSVDEQRSFVHDTYQQQDYDQWRLEAPRRGIMVQRLLHWIQMWRNKMKKE